MSLWAIMDPSQSIQVSVVCVSCVSLCPCLYFKRFFLSWNVFVCVHSCMSEGEWRELTN